MRVSIQNKLTKNISSISEINQWRFLANNRVFNTVFQQHFQFILSDRFSVNSGVSYTIQYPSTLDSPYTLGVPEIRPIQEFNYFLIRKTKNSLALRIGLEERFVHKNNNIVLLPGENFSFRHRYRIFYQNDITPKWAKKRTFFKVSDELFFNQGKQFVYNKIDQNRLSVSFEHNLHRKFSVELGFMNIFQKQNTKDKYTIRELYKISLNHKLDFTRNY